MGDFRYFHTSQIWEDSLLRFPIPKPTFLSSIEEFFICEWVFPDIVCRDKSTTIFHRIFYELCIYLWESITLYTVAIRRICDDGCLFVVFEKVPHFKHDILSDTCSFGIFSCNSYHLRIYIWCVYLVFSTWIWFVSCFSFDQFKEASIMKGKRLYSEVSLKSWRNISRDHDGFDWDSSTSAKWVEDWTFVLPVRKCDECCCETFLDGCLTCLSSISAFMKGFTCDIEEDMCDIIDDEDEDMDFDSVCDIWSIECGVYCLLSDWLYRRSAWKCRASCRSLYDDIFFSCEIVRPLYPFAESKECIKVCDFCLWKWYINSVGEPTPHEEFVGIFECSVSFDESILSSDICESDAFTFPLCEWLESWLASEYKWEWFLEFESCSFCCVGKYFYHARECIEKMRKCKKYPKRDINWELQESHLQLY